MYAERQVLAPWQVLACVVPCVTSADGVRALPNVSVWADVEYFACRRCSHVWNLPKGEDVPFGTSRTSPPCCRKKRPAEAESPGRAGHMHTWFASGPVGKS